MQPGDVIGQRFEVERLAAEGGMGAVWRARDRHTDRLAAVKVMRAVDPRGALRFAREARILAELSHPRIVRYLAHGRISPDEDELFLAMEWLDGEDLSARLQGSELKLGDTLRLATQAAAALAAAHARGIVHRDLKPSNLFLADYRLDSVKLLDFGVARLPRAETLTDTGVAVGTLVFMAPEQARGQGGVDARADVFALGAVMYRCLTGRLPFPGNTPAEVMAHLVDPRAPRPGELVDLPAKIDELVTRMLCKDPAGRPASGAAVLAELVDLDVTVPGGRLGQAPVAGLTGAERRACCLLLVRAAELPAAAARVVAFHGGAAERDGDDTVVVLTGDRVASDQARQAARCALRLRGLVGDAAMALVLGWRDPSSTNSTSDGPLARARRLAEAPAGGVRVDEALAGLLDAHFALAGDERGLVLFSSPGSGAVQLDDEPRTLLGSPTPFIGREKEVAVLEAMFDTSAGEGEAHAALILGPPGLGKTRLRQELARRLARRGRVVEIWLGRGDAMSAGSPLALLGDAVRNAAGIAGSEGPDEQLRILRRRVGRHLPPERADRVAELLGEALGVGAPGEAAHLVAMRRDPPQLAERVRAAWLEWLAAECEAQPLVLMLEDLHWGDALSLRLVDAGLAAMAERPLLVLGFSRPEADELFPRLWAERGLQVVHLGELGRRASEKLVRRVLGDGVAAETVAELCERAGGNVFYLEELIRQVAAGRPDELPETVLAMTEARLNALPAEARRALRAASVFGEVFWAGGVGELLRAGADELEPVLADLAARELVRRRESTRFAGEEELTFRHALVREAAYAMLTDGDRQLGHRLAGGWLEQRGARAELLMHHFGRGGDGERAAGQALVAADDLMRHAHFTEAGRALAAAHGWLGEAGGPLRAQVLLREENLAETMGQRERQRQLVDALFAAVGEGDDVLHAEALLRRGYYHATLGHHADADLDFERSLEHARRGGDRGAELRAVRGKAFLRWQEGRHAEAAVENARALELDRELGDEALYAHDLVHLGQSLLRSGDLAGAGARLEEAIALGERLTDPLSRIHVLHFAGNMQRERGELEAALASFRRSVTVGEENHLFGYSMSSRSAIAATQLRMGDLEASLAAYREIVALARRIDYAVELAQTLRTVSGLLAAAGRRAEALRDVEESIAVLGRLEDAAGRRGAEGERALLLHGLAQEAWRAGRPGEALERWQRAAEAFTAAGDRAGEGMARNSAGAALRALGRLDEAAEVLAAAVALNEAGGQKTLVADGLTVLGHVEAERGRLGEARAAYEAALALRRAASAEGRDERRRVALLLGHLARVHRRADAPERAWTCVVEARRLAVELNDDDLRRTVSALLDI